ncbi:DUF6151 family protein [Pseudomonas borbori]
MPQPIRCTCGHLQGLLERTQASNRLLCYCTDCQAFAHYLQRAEQVLDARGGSDIVQTRPQWVSFSAGVEYLACMRLSEKGLLRWYACCCNTPIGNTLATAKFAFVGLIHNCLGDHAVLDQAFGPVRAHVNTASAHGEPKPPTTGMAGTLLRAAGHMLKARLDGSYKHTPFFTPDGAPSATPTVLSPAQREALRHAASAAARHQEN